MELFRRLSRLAITKWTTKLSKKCQNSGKADVANKTISRTVIKVKYGGFWVNILLINIGDSFFVVGMSEGGRVRKRNIFFFIARCEQNRENIYCLFVFDWQSIRLVAQTTVQRVYISSETFTHAQDAGKGTCATARPCVSVGGAPVTLRTKTFWSCWRGRTSTTYPDVMLTTAPAAMVNAKSERQRLWCVCVCEWTDGGVRIISTLSLFVSPIKVSWCFLSPKTS